MRALFLSLLTLAACSSPEPTAPAAGGDGLSPRQAADLARLGAPVLVPGDAGGYTLASVQIDRQQRDAFSTVDYALLYRRGTACVVVRGTNDGVGGPEYPAEARTVRLRNVPGQPSVAVYRASTAAGSEEAEAWGAGTVVSDFIELGDGPSLMLASVRSADDLGTPDARCQPAPLDDVAGFTASLRVLPTESGGSVRPPSPPTPPTPTDLTDLGDFAPAPTVESDPAIQSGISPEDASRGLAERYDGEAQNVQVQIVQSVGREATVLVTAEGLTDDSVAGERYRLMYRQGEGGTWELESAGVQVRCHTGRGHTDWSTALCN